MEGPARPLTGVAARPGAWRSAAAAGFKAEGLAKLTAWKQDNPKLAKIKRRKKRNGKPGNPDIVLRYLRDIDRKVDRLIDEMRNLTSRVTGPEVGLSLVNSRLDRVEGRLDRIERRLGLSQASP